MYLYVNWGVALVPMRHLEHRNATPFLRKETPFLEKKCYICSIFRSNAHRSILHTDKFN